MIRHLIARAPRLTLVLFCLAAWAPGLFALPAGDRDESRFAQATRQMIETGDYVRIMNGTEPRNRKPIGIHWLQAPFVLAAHAAGLATENPSWPYRLPSILGGLAAVLATFELGLILGGQRQLGFLAASMLGGCVILVVETHIAKTDAALLGTVSIAMAMLARAWMGMTVRLRHAALFWLAIGGGILLKGPVAPMVLGLTILALGLSSRRWRWLLPLRPALGVPLMLAVVLPWFVAIEIATGGAFVAQAVGGDLGHKLAGGSESHGGFPGLHLLLLPLLTFPSCAFILAALPHGWARRREPAIQFLLAWLLPCWIVFEAVPTRLPHYTLPLYPALFLLASFRLCGAPPQKNPLPLLREREGPVVRSTPARDAKRPEGEGLADSEESRRPTLSMDPVRPGRLARLAPLLVGTALGGASLALAIFLRGPLWLGLAPAICCGLCAAVAWRGRPLLGLLAAVPAYCAILQVELPSLPALWLAPRTRAALIRDRPGWNAHFSGLAVAGYAEPSLMFATGDALRLLPDGRSGAVALAGAGISVVIVEGRDLPAFSAEAARTGLAPKLLDRVDGFNISRGRWASLSLFSR